MTAQWPEWASHRDPERRRRVIRWVAAALSAATAGLYFGIGAGVIEIVDKTAPDMPDLLPFGVASGAAFVLGAILLLAIDHRGVWLLGALFQVGVIVMYVVVAPQRTPSFEPWGILIKVLEAAILVSLAYLVVRHPVRRGARVARIG